MSEMQQVAKNTAFQATGKILGTILGMLSSIIVIRHLGEAEYGVYTTAFAYLQLFGTLSDFGLYVILLKYLGVQGDVAKDETTGKNSVNEYVNTIFTLRVVINVSLLLSACVIVWLLPQYSVLVRLAVLVLALNFFFISMNQLLTGIYQKNLAMYTVGIAEVVSKVVLFLATILAVYVFNGNVLVILSTVVAAGAVNFGQLLYGVLKRETLRLHWDTQIVKELLVQCWPIALSIGFNIIYFKMDTIVLSWFYDDAVVGVYGAPYKILEVIITLPAMIVGLVMPLLSRAYTANDMGRFKELYQQSFDVLTILALPMIMGSFIVAQPAMEFVAGADYSANVADLGPLLQILTFAVASIFIGTLIGYLIVIVNEQKRMIWAYAFVAVTAMSGYLYFIPRYSYYGAASVTVYAELCILICGLLVIYWKTRVLPNAWSFFRILLASIGMYLLLLPIAEWSFFVLIPLGGLFYLLLLLVMRVVSKDQLKSMLQRG